MLLRYVQGDTRLPHAHHSALHTATALIACPSAPGGGGACNWVAMQGRAYGCVGCAGCALTGVTTSDLNQYILPCFNTNHLRGL